jgi:hypothetical protein
VVGNVGSPGKLRRHRPQRRDSGSSTVGDVACSAMTLLTGPGEASGLCRATTDSVVLRRRAVPTRVTPAVYREAARIVPWGVGWAARAMVEREAGPENSADDREAPPWVFASPCWPRSRGGYRLATTVPGSSSRRCSPKVWWSAASMSPFSLPATLGPPAGSPRWCRAAGRRILARTRRYPNASTSQLSSSALESSNSSTTASTSCR